MSLHEGQKTPVHRPNCFSISDILLSNPPLKTLPTSERPKLQVKKRGRRRLLQDEEQRKARRKAQCKLNQRRYRARQRGIISTLMLETEGLNGHFQDLHDYREFLRHYFLRDTASTWTIWNDPRPLLVAKHLVRAFRSGFALHSYELSNLQESFVRLVCAPDLIAQGATTDGVEALLLQLKRYTSYHGTLEIRSSHVNIVHTPVMDRQANEEKLTWIVAIRGAMRLRISRDTLMLVYPHVLRHHDRIAQRIVGQTIEPEFLTTLYFDTRGKVTKFDQHVDFAGAFIQLLNSMDDVVTLLDGALISSFSELGVDNKSTKESALPLGCKQLSLKFILL
ncbi:hypothetical protein CCR75_009250 [Bremia lactucae]|uniref:Uncharacterized protein n=1 Tax=Bremia lactucae TaxID=4779 RepID=A0A976FK26_BRELC|nr:hypothetical protein CCR75_009250 [Bremia lactucae]